MATDPYREYCRLLDELEATHQRAVEFCQQRKAVVEREIADLTVEIARLRGERAKKKRGIKPLEKKQITLHLLADMLSALPDKTLNIRKEGYDVKQIRQLAAEYPLVIKMGGSRAWPTVTYNGR